MRSYDHSKKVLLPGFHFRRTKPLRRIIATFKKIEMGTHSKTDPIARLTIERTPARTKAPKATISDVIATGLLGPEIVKRS